MLVLVAGTDISFLELVQSFLWDCGHECEIAGDGLECLAVGREFRPDVIVLESDLLWGGMEGVLAELREDFYLSQIPIILASKCHRELDASKHPMIVAQIPKPYRLSELIRQLDVVRKRIAPRDESKSPMVESNLIR